MKVIIISGSYGWRPENSVSVKTVRRGDSCDVSPEEAKRLVAIGVAEYAAEEDVTTPPTDTGSNGGGTMSPGQETPPAPPCALSAEDLPDSAEVLDIVDGHFTEESLSKMKNADLKSLAIDLGLDPKNCGNKAEYVALLLTVEITEEDGEDSAPNITTDETIVQ